MNLLTLSGAFKDMLLIKLLMRARIPLE